MIYSYNLIIKLVVSKFGNNLLVIKDYVNVNYKILDTNIESMYLIFTINQFTLNGIFLWTLYFEP